VIFGDFSLQMRELRQNGYRQRQPANKKCYMLSCISWALAQISCFHANHTFETVLLLAARTICYMDRDPQRLLTQPQWLTDSLQVCMHFQYFRQCRCVSLVMTSHACHSPNVLIWYSSVATGKKWMCGSAHLQQVTQ